MRPPALALGLVLTLFGCGGEDPRISPDNGGTAGAGGQAIVPDASTDASSEDAGDASSKPGVPEPIPSDILFSPTQPLPLGEQLLFSDWSTIPNRLLSIRPDGSGEVEIFRAFRIVSFALSHSTDVLAFACGDPLQVEHYGVTLGDAIQNTWLYDVESQVPKALSWGNQSDGCLEFSMDDEHLYTCRLYDFMPDDTFQLFRLGRFQLPSGTFEFLGHDVPNEHELDPHVAADESSIFYTRVRVMSEDDWRHSVAWRTTPDGPPSVLQTDAIAGPISPDGTALLFSEFVAPYRLFRMNLDGTNVVQLTSHRTFTATWSPDGTRVAYLYNEGGPCSHIEIVKADGSEADTPLRVRDCVNDPDSNVFNLAWIDRK